MAYLDLNPVHAEMAETPETSDHTSIQERIPQKFDLTAAVKSQPLANPFELPLPLLASFENAIEIDQQSGCLHSLSDCLQLVDRTGRAIREDMRDAIKHRLSPILRRLGNKHTSG